MGQWNHRRIHNEAAAWIVMEQEIVVVSGSGSLETENDIEQQHLKKQDMTNICIYVFLLSFSLCISLSTFIDKWSEYGLLFIINIFPWTSFSLTSGL